MKNYENLKMKKNIKKTQINIFQPKKTTSNHHYRQFLYRQ